MNASGDVVLSSLPWLNGMHAVGWFGPVEIHRTVLGMSWERGIDEVMEAAADEARARGCNAVVNLEIFCDPYARDGGQIELRGTLANYAVTHLGESWI